MLFLFVCFINSTFNNIVTDTNPTVKMEKIITKRGLFARKTSTNEGMCPLLKHVAGLILFDQKCHRSLRAAPLLRSSKY